jgi:hypothetical protein
MLRHHPVVHGTKSEIHLEFGVETIERIVGEDYCLLALALVQVVREEDTTASRAFHVKRRPGRGLFHRLPNDAYPWISMQSIGHFLFILHVVSCAANAIWWHGCTCFH